MDASILVAIVGLFGTIATASAGVVIAIMVNRKEKKQSAESSLEKAYKERLDYKDEKIADLQQQLAEEKLNHADAEARADRYQLAIDEMRAEEREHNNER